MSGRFELGRVRGEVTVHRTGDVVTVVRGDRVSHFEVVDGATALQLKSGGRKFDAAVHYRKDREIHVWINGRTLSFTWTGRSAFSHAAERAGSERLVLAVMPGRVVRVNVKPGELVSEGASLLVLEAMKMENEIKAGMTGRVAEVAVSPGNSVETGTLLVRLEDVAEETT